MQNGGVGRTCLSTDLKPDIVRCNFSIAAYLHWTLARWLRLCSRKMFPSLSLLPSWCCSWWWVVYLYSINFSYLVFHLYTYYRICLVVFLDDQRSFPVGNALALCGHVGKNACIVWCYICFLAIGYCPPPRYPLILKETSIICICMGYTVNFVLYQPLFIQTLENSRRNCSSAGHCTVAAAAHGLLWDPGLDCWTKADDHRFPKGQKKHYTKNGDIYFVFTKQNILYGYGYSLSVPQKWTYIPSKIWQISDVSINGNLEDDLWLTNCNISRSSCFVFPILHRICERVLSKGFRSTFMQECLSMSALIFVNRL